MYNVSYTYDKHGNMTSLARRGKKDLTEANNVVVDQLTMTYAGNQLLKADDNIANIALAESADFKNYTNQAIEYTYNKNGAMAKDLNKGISSIAYNSLNLPRQMDIKSPVAEARNEYTYTAGGQKLKVKQSWNSNYSTSPVIGSTINPTALDISKTTDYVGNMIYENGTLKRVLVDGGYYEGGVYYFYLNDHLGNNRVVANASGGVVQKTHYYPFGMAFAESTEQDKQPYKYNGKELDQMHGLNLYDYSARYYESAVGRFTSVDPLAEKYYSISPYVYCNNNPLKYIDPTGMSYGDFINEKGKIIGNDGKNDRKLYAIKTTKTKFDNPETTSAGITKEQKNATEKFIKNNSGNIAAFKNNSIAYDNSAEIEGDASVRQAIYNEVSRDNGKGGTGDNQNREFGGNIINGKAVAATPGNITNPLVNDQATITLQVGSPSYHSHSSGTASVRTSSSSTISSLGASSTVGGTITTTVADYHQAPSSLDIKTAGSHTHYVFGRRDKNVYIYNSQGVQAVFRSEYFVNPKR